MSKSDGDNNIDWNNVVKKEAIGLNGEDLGEVSEVGNSFIVTQKGIINKKRYYLPKKSVTSFDGSVLRLNMTNNDLEGYRETEGRGFNEYPSFESSDMSKELETKIPVMGESLEVSKRMTENKVRIIKTPVKEIKKVDIELTHEEITIERIPTNDDTKPSGSTEIPVQSKTEIIIQLKREEPVVKKTPYVKEEVIVRKRPITETKSITEVLVDERVNYDDRLNEDLK
ncbi:MAG TPA: YsnF/AvaK domain-containing protein [Phototrophicaceae bacterium]|nr:YsnF/AvaK domain-containing protein [Phototrophicaceae bacterium]